MQSGTSSRESLARFRRHARQKSWRSHGLTWRGIDTGGKGPALVLLPGTLGTAEIFWNQIDALRGRARVLSLTYPRSASAPRMVASLAGLLRQLGLDRASLLGSSFGGYMVQSFAARHPEMVETAFIANSLSDPASTRRLFASPEQVRAAPGAKLRAGMGASMAAWPDGTPALADLRDCMLAELQRAPMRAVKAKLLALMQAPPLPARLPLPDVRIVVIDSADDPLITPAMRAGVLKRHPEAQHHRFEGAGHFPYISQAPAYTEVIAKRLGV